MKFTCESLRLFGAFTAGFSLTRSAAKTKSGNRVMQIRNGSSILYTEIDATFYLDLTSKSHSNTHGTRCTAFYFTFSETATKEKKIVNILGSIVANNYVHCSFR